MKKWTAAVVATTIVSSATAGMQVNVTTVPESPIPGRQFAIELNGEYDNPCGTIGIPEEFELISENAIPTYVVSIDVLGCNGIGFNIGSFYRRQAFGAFPLPEDIGPEFEIVVQTRRHGDESAYEETARTIVTTASSRSTSALTPGIYWSSEAAGTGFAVERQSDSIFVAGYLYDESGSPMWLTAQGRLVDGMLESEFMRTMLPGLPCDGCPPRSPTGLPLGLPHVSIGPGGLEISPPPPSTDPVFPMALFVTGSGGAIVTLGDVPGPALSLVRFGLEYSAAPGIRGSTFVDMSGTWFFADTAPEPDDSGPLTSRRVVLQDRGTGSIFGADFDSEDSALSVECFHQFSVFRTICRLIVDDMVAAEVPAVQLSHDHMNFGAIKAWRLD